MSSFPLWIKFLHVASSLWLAAGVFASAVVRVQAKRAATAGDRRLAVRILWRMHSLFTLPGLIVTGLVGFYLVTALGYRFAEVWVAASSLIYLLMLLSTLFAITPSLRRLHGAALAAAESEEAVPRFEVLAREKLWGILSDVNALAILVLVMLMVLKP